jgi:hypothetical protein
MTPRAFRNYVDEVLGPINYHCLLYLRMIEPIMGLTANVFIADELAIKPVLL